MCVRERERESGVNEEKRRNSRDVDSGSHVELIYMVGCSDVALPEASKDADRRE